MLLSPFTAGGDVWNTDSAILTLNDCNDGAKSVGQLITPSEEGRRALVGVLSRVGVYEFIPTGGPTTSSFWELGVQNGAFAAIILLKNRDESKYQDPWRIIGKVVTRPEIKQFLYWVYDFVEGEQGVESAKEEIRKKIREAQAEIDNTSSSVKVIADSQATAVMTSIPDHGGPHPLYGNMLRLLGCPLHPELRVSDRRALPKVEQ